MSRTDRAYWAACAAIGALLGVGLFVNPLGAAWAIGALAFFAVPILVCIFFIWAVK